MVAGAVTLEHIEALDRAHLLHPIAEIGRGEPPRIFVGGSGVELELADGRRILDGFSGLFNINVGHGRREIADAVAAQMRELAYYPSFWSFGNVPAAQLAERLVGLLPADRGLRHVLFGTGGSESNETNFRLARLYHAVRGQVDHRARGQGLAGGPLAGVSPQEQRGAGERARHHPRLDRGASHGPHKLERTAMEEVRSGLIQYTLPTNYEGSPRGLPKE